MEKRVKQSYPSVSEIDEKKHVAMVKDIFGTIFRRYDSLNHIFSGGIDMIWRRTLTRRARFFRTYRFLDVATGTADLALETARRHPSVAVTGIDFVAEMLEVGRKKVAATRFTDRIELIEGDALSLPFPTDSFDTTAIAFGIRNITSRSRALREMTRVIVPGGRVMVLELNLPYFQTFKAVYALYLNRILPAMALVLSRNPAAYAYLSDSIMHFPSPQNFSRLMEETGLTSVEACPLTFGIAYLYTGEKPSR